MKQLLGMSSTHFSSPHLQCRELTCERNDRVLFSNLNFDLNEGEALHVIGANGSGKSSLLKIVCGLLLPDEGQVFWKQKCITECRSIYLKELIYLGHEVGLKNGLTARENLEMLQALNHEKNGSGLTNALHNMEVKPFENILVNQLSAGQRRRVALARLLNEKKKIWILDEPFSALDIDFIPAIESILVKHIQQKGMIILTSHQSISFLEKCKKIFL